MPSGGSAEMEQMTEPGCAGGQDDSRRGDASGERSGEASQIAACEPAGHSSRRGGKRIGEEIAGAGAEQLRGRIGANVSLRPLGRGPTIEMHAVLDALRGEGCNVVLTEGGPRLVGQLLRARLLDELFLTISPVLFGRSLATPREGLMEGVSFGASDAAKLDLRSVRHHLGYLFLRYSCRTRSLP